MTIQDQKTKICKSKFTPVEDRKLLSLVKMSEDKDWTWIASQMPNRNPRQCRERYGNYLNPSLQKGAWTKEEDDLIIEKKKIFGQKWAVIAGFLKGRSGNDVRNRWLMLMRHQNKNSLQQPQPAPPIQMVPEKPQEHKMLEPTIKNLEKKMEFAPILSLMPDIKIFPIRL